MTLKKELREQADNLLTKVSKQVSDKTIYLRATHKYYFHNIQYFNLRYPDILRVFAVLIVIYIQLKGNTYQVDTGWGVFDIRQMKEVE